MQYFIIIYHVIFVSQFNILLLLSFRHAIIQVIGATDKQRWWREFIVCPEQTLILCSFQNNFEIELP